MTTPNIDLLLSDITFRRGWLAKMIEVTVHNGDDTRFDAVSIVDLIHEIRALREQRDAAVKRRREIDDEAFDYAEQIETLRTQLAAARVLLKSVPFALNAAFSAGAEERENGSDRRQEKQMETVYAMRKAITAALSEATP